MADATIAVKIADDDRSETGCPFPLLDYVDELKRGFWKRVRRLYGATDPEPRFLDPLDSLDSRTVHKLAAQGFLMKVEAGQRLATKGLVRRELFVLEGAQGPACSPSGGCVTTAS